MDERTVRRILGGIRSGPLALGLNVTAQTKPAYVRDLIRKLRPQDCGKDLIRIGGKKDGGYLIPDDLEGIEYCFSPGVSNVSDFENDLADRHIKSFLADYSVDSPPITRPEFTFDKIWLGSSDRGQHMTLASWKDKYLNGYSGDLILQMDIEGSEYEVILNTPDRLLHQFRIMVIEFHFLDRLFDPFAFRFLSSSFQKILEFFHVAHIHPNNADGVFRKGQIEIPRILEFTFINKDRVSSTRPQAAFPHKLDADNGSARPLPLPKCWYSPT
jgi:Methyltransferase FkbM domain